MTAKSGRFTIQPDHDRRIVRVLASGRFRKEDGERMITAARSLATENGYGVFYDVRRVTTDIPLEEWFHLPRELAVLNQPRARSIRVAILTRPGPEDSDYKFYELVSVNVGLDVRVMHDQTEALEWLDTGD